MLDFVDADVHVRTASMKTHPIATRQDGTPIKPVNRKQNIGSTTGGIDVI
jgi:hypothetical protein